MATAPAPRTDGCYVRQEPDRSWSYLCLYTDGTAGTVTATEPPRVALPAVRGRHPAMSFGPVEPTRRGFRVETTNAEGTVLFRAIIEPDGTLTVASRSRINGGSLVLRYRFVPFPPEP